MPNSRSGKRYLVAKAISAALALFAGLPALIALPAAALQARTCVEPMDSPPTRYSACNSIPTRISRMAADLFCHRGARSAWARLTPEAVCGCDARCLLTAGFPQGEELRRREHSATGQQPTEACEDRSRKDYRRLVRGFCGRSRLLGHETRRGGAWGFSGEGGEVASLDRVARLLKGHPWWAQWGQASGSARFCARATINRCPLSRNLCNRPPRGRNNTIGLNFARGNRVSREHFDGLFLDVFACLDTNRSAKGLICRAK